MPHYRTRRFSAAKGARTSSFVWLSRGLAGLLIALAMILGCGLGMTAETRLDVNDVSYLWPVPEKAEDVGRLISANDLLADGKTRVWPEASFDAVLKAAAKVGVTNSAGRRNEIKFDTPQGQFTDPGHWKLVSFRVDPSAPGCDPAVTRVFGSHPQFRLVMQPVTTDPAGKVKVHDVCAHLVFSYILAPLPPAGPGLPARAVPDKDAFGQIVEGLRALKADSSNVPTSGKLSIHPALKDARPGFGEKVKDFLCLHVKPEKLSGVAFMGIETPEPWIFFAMVPKDDQWIHAPHPAIGNQPAQMLTFSRGDPVMPSPTPSNLGEREGVSTAVLFGRDVSKKLSNPVFQGRNRPVIKDIPNIIANPKRCHFGNTDCVSCHTESLKRKMLGIEPDDQQFTFELPKGVSGVDETLLPNDDWNVRNFGWFPRRGKPTAATVTVRTANEAAESVEFIEAEYPPVKPKP